MPQDHGAMPDNDILTALADTPGVLITAGLITTDHPPDQTTYSIKTSYKIQGLTICISAPTADIDARIITFHKARGEPSEGLFRIVTSSIKILAAIRLNKLRTQVDVSLTIFRS